MRRRLTLAAGATAGLLTLATLRLFVLPSTDDRRPVDAVVVFAGGRGERLALAEQLMAEGLAADLVVPNGTAPEWPAGNEACVERRAYDVHCPTPRPDTTRGEARAIAELADTEGWEDILVVSSTYHLARAGLLLDRCHDGTVLTSAATPRIGAGGWARRVAHEWLGWARAMTVERGC